MRKINAFQEQYLLSKLRMGSQEAFSFLFNTFYADLVLFCGNFIKEKENCEDIVQSVFLKLWEDRENIQIDTSLQSYLLKSVQNRCLDEIRHVDIVRQYATNTNLLTLEAYNTDQYILYSDLKEHLNNALKELPYVCREAFELNRFDGLRYKEIAEKLGVSERTIEVRISKALGLLRTHLKEFFIVMISLFFH